MRTQAQRGCDCHRVKLQSQRSNPGPWDFTADAPPEGHVSQDWVHLLQRLEPPQELRLQVQSTLRCPGHCVFPPGGRQLSCPVMPSCPHLPVLQAGIELPGPSSGSLCLFQLLTCEQNRHSQAKHFTARVRPSGQSDRQQEKCQPLSLSGAQRGLGAEPPADQGRVSARARHKVVFNVRDLGVTCYCSVTELILAELYHLLIAVKRHEGLFASKASGPAGPGTLSP